ncbi:4-hydroxy-tetrahydrodipicolinate reductase [Rickettsiales endosymbiont of Stachyamoeba lipophora]|uniref:4-hydroxy-tetrahydrodipicolinate reductase n=1 Tax=Rickettsiales endosymbiont of Stachyamoeba lipophora TaxID=2486578 RepID=UPI000F64CEAF|nr:4-hydroxy-tetrahydrodipicolinate reductase [Rickettsiales endosymbiont of Stachyamoeba lipophora]AZL15368.1 4-hydroxy-tetrahydrodipicolinate reductase [Rickettsiales endosymbiont of Stachyamoeba lipophora]
MKIIVFGAGGKVGTLICEYLLNQEEHELVGAIVSQRSVLKGEQVYNSSIIYDDKVDDYLADADVIIDFSCMYATLELITKLKDKPLPIVIGTTGFNVEALTEIRKYTQHAPIMLAANFSLGIILLKKAAQEMKSYFGLEFDVEIIETHHNLKKDAPSGTSLNIAQALGFKDSDIVTSQRYLGYEPRTQGTVGISSIRGGNNFGEQEIRFIGNNEEIRISHHAFTRKIYVEGAIKAAEWLIDKSHKMYTIEDMFN